MSDDDDRWRLAFENASDIIVIAEVESGRILDANPAACATLGRGREALLAMRQPDLHPPEMAAITRRLFAEAVAGTRSASAETFLLAADGARIPVEVRDRAFILDGRRVVLEVFRDLRERRRVEAALAESEARFAVVLRSSPLGIHLFHLEADGRLVLTDANPAADRLLGLDHRPVLGRSIEEAIPGLAGTPVPDRYRNCAASGEPWALARLDYEHGGTAASFEVHVFRYAERRIAAQFSDISERVRLEERLRHGERLEAVGRLAGGVAHDFNNHLTAILGHAELIAATAGEERVVEWAKTIAAAADRAAALTRQLLTFSRRGQVRSEMLDPNRLVREAAALLGGSLPKRIKLELDLSPAPPAVRGDAAQLTNAIINLALNGADAMPAGGTLTLATGAVRLDQAAAHGLYGHPKPGHFVRIAVSDHGRGIDPDVRRHLFEPFVTTKKGKGTGLGLASVFGAVAGHRGGIAVDSSGSGTCVALHLPAQTSTAADPGTARIVAGALKARVLVIDDEPAVRRVLCESLRSLGCQVDEAESGGEALRRWADSGPYDLVVLDLLMPGMAGEQVFRSLRDASPNAAILLVSGNGPGGAVGKLIEEGAKGFLPKPFTFGRLAEAVRAALGQR